MEHIGFDDATADSIWPEVNTHSYTRVPLHLYEYGSYFGIDTCTWCGTYIHRQCGITFSLPTGGGSGIYMYQRVSRLSL